jgi:hypothetical protein
MTKSLPETTPKKLFSSFDDLDSLDDDEVKEAESKGPTDETNPAPDSLINDDKKNDNSIDNDDDEKNKNKNKNNSITKTHNNNTEPFSEHKEFTLVKSKKSPPTTLDLAVPKAHTAKWRKVDAAYTNLGLFMAIDRPKAEAEISRSLKFLKKTATAVLSRDEWTKVFSAHASASDKSSAKFLKQLGARLASSNPQELFLPHEFQDKKLFQGTLANAWAGAYVFYGPAWLPDTVISLDISKGLNKPSKWWTTLSDEARHNIIPFSLADLFSDTSDSMHDLERLLKKNLVYRVLRTSSTPWNGSRHSHLSRTRTVPPALPSLSLR